MKKKFSIKMNFFIIFFYFVIMKIHFILMMAVILSYVSCQFPDGLVEISPESVEEIPKETSVKSSEEGNLPKVEYGDNKIKGNKEKENDKKNGGKRFLMNDSIIQAKLS